jgi:hypothetical protein
MAASYPTALKTYTDKVDNVDYVKAADINSLQSEVAAIESTLGINAGTSLLPSSAGNFAYSGGATTLAGRVQNLEAFSANSSFYFSSANYSISSPTTALQNVYAASGSSLSLAASTNYLIEGMLWVAISAGSTPTQPSLQFTFSGTVTQSLIEVLETWNTTGYGGISNIVSTYLDSAYAVNSAFNLTVNTSGSAVNVTSQTAYCRVRFSGMVRVSTAGLFTPQISLTSNTGITISGNQNSWIRATAIDGGNSVGTWS